MKIAARITVLLLAAAALAQTTSCAWFQKNEPKLICAGESTVADLPELVTIITECATIAASTENIVPCILAAAGSKWTEDVIACVANTQASAAAAVSAQTSQPAATRATVSIKPENLARLKIAVSTKWGGRLGVRQ